MTKQKTISELNTEITANERQLAQLRNKQQQLENCRSYYEKGDRRKQAHRLITRGAAIEGVASLTKVLTETEFYAFAEKAFSFLYLLYSQEGRREMQCPFHTGQGVGVCSPETHSGCDRLHSAA